MKVTEAARRRTIATLGAAVVAFGLSACANAGGRPVSFPAGSAMDRIHRAGWITVGVKVDQPDDGFRNLATGRLEGFDIELAQIVARALGLPPGRIRYVEAVSGQREHLLERGQVDIILASYSITPARRRLVGQAGPYYVTGQQLLVRAEDKARISGPDHLAGLRVCSVAGSTPYARIQQKRYRARAVPATYYTQCVQQLLTGSVDAVTTDGALLSAYAAQQPDRLQVVGAPFSQERYGIGYRRGDQAFCRFLTDTIIRAEGDGDWQRAFDATLGRAGATPANMPTPDPCA